jgi:MoxR-like ATPase
MATKPRLFEKGNKLDRTRRFIYKGEQLELAPYLPDEGLKLAVQLAIILERPLLLKGEPGSGKTKLAEAVAYDLFDEQFRDYYFEWNVKSTSKAQEGLYTINHLQRLRDANLRGPGPAPASAKGVGRPGIAGSLDIVLPTGQDKGTYIELGPLGRAFLATNRMSGVRPPVLLIDEIDKADIDFPNDLLQELDRMRFDIPEAVDEKGKPVKITAEKGRKPLIIITSNEEKSLPAAFLRRCLFHYIRFPNPKELAAIVEARWPEMNKDFVANAIRVFTELHDVIKIAATSIKNISTSELVDWITLLHHYHPKADGSFSFAEIPFDQALAKDIETMQTFLKYKQRMLTKPAPAAS